MTGLGRFFDNERLEQIFKSLLEEGPVPPGRLAQRFHVTERTIRSDVQSMNRVLSPHGAHVETKRGKGYLLRVDDPESFSAYTSLESEKEAKPAITTMAQRQLAVLSRLLDTPGYLSAQRLMRGMYISRDTLNEYLRRIKAQIEPYGLELIQQQTQGYKIFGAESQKRACLLNEVIGFERESSSPGFTTKEQSFCDGVALASVREVIKSLLDAANVETSDYGLRHLTLVFAIAVMRIRRGFEVEPCAGHQPLEEVEQLLRKLCESLESQCQIAISSNERDQLRLQLLLETSLGAEEVDQHRLDLQIEEALGLIEDDWGFNLKDDLTLVNGLRLHLTSIMKEHLIQKRMRNPLLNTIKNTFPLPYEITLSAFAPVFERAGEHLTEDELGYLALHVGASIERHLKRAVSSTKSLVVCDAGRAAGQMLSARLESLFANKLEVTNVMSFHEFESNQPDALKEVDLIVTTTHIPNVPLQEVIVDFELSARNVREIVRTIEKRGTGTFDSIQRFFSPSAFRVVDEPIEKEALLADMCSQLVDSRGDAERLLGQVIERERLSSTALSDSFAIAHPITPGQEQTRVAVSILRIPCLWDDDHPRIQIVFLLVLQPHDTVGIERLYDLLVQIAKERDFQRALSKCSSYAETLHALEENMS